MKIIIKIVSVIAIIIGIMAIVAGGSVLLGFSTPDYQYFNSLVIYNVVLGFVSLLAGYFIWTDNKRALPLSYLITSLHILVLLLLLTAFSHIISKHSVAAMSFRSIVWAVISAVVFLWNSKRKIETN